MLVDVDIRTLAKALAVGALAAFCPGLLAIPFAIAAPLAILIPIMTFGIAYASAAEVA